MKFSMRVKLVSILVASLVMLAGSAWADLATVKGKIETYGGLTVTETNATTLTVTGTKENATAILELGDISGLTIDWQATLTSTAGNTRNFRLIRMSGSGTFKISDGATISLGETSPTTEWPCVIWAAKENTVTMTGGTLNMTCSEGSAIENAGTVSVTGGTINAENGSAIGAGPEPQETYPTVTVSATSTISGFVFKSVSGKKEIDVYGDCQLITEDSCNWTGMDITKVTLKEGASLTIHRPIIGRDNVEIVADNGAVLNSKFDSVGNITIGTDVVGVNSAVDAVAPNGETSVSELEKSGVPSNTIMPLEVFKVDDASTTGVFLKSYTMKLEKVAGYKVGELVVIKLMKNAPAAPEKLAREEPGSVGDGQFSVTDANGTPLPAGHVIQSGVDYIITIGIADGGNYDWDNNPGTIIDPAGIGAESGGGSGGGGGGCNVGGYGVIALLLAAVGLVTRKSRKA